MERVGRQDTDQETDCAKEEVKASAPTGSIQVKGQSENMFKYLRFQKTMAYESYYKVLLDHSL